MSAAETAIAQARALLKADKEAVRAAHWAGASRAARFIAVKAGGLSSDRAELALREFNAFERGTVNLALRRLIAELEVVACAMQGGQVPDRTPRMAAHEPDQRGALN